MKSIVSLLALLLSFSAFATESGRQPKVLRLALNPTTEIGLFRNNALQPRCLGCAAVSVIIHQRVVPGATQVYRVDADFRGKTTVLSDFHHVGGDVFGLPVSDTFFHIAVPRGANVPRAELTAYSRNCLNPRSPRCTRPRKAGTLVAYANQLLELPLISEAEAVRAMIPRARGAHLAE